MQTEVRIDKWLWAVRIFKTRTQAAEECRKNRIVVNDIVAKPSRDIRIGDIILVKKPPVTYSFKVLQLCESRMGAKLVPGYLLDMTPADQLELLQLNRINKSLIREKGTGRPTKKERRDVDKFMGNE